MDYEESVKANYLRQVKNNFGSTVAANYRFTCGDSDENCLLLMDNKQIAQYLTKNPRKKKLD